MRYYNPAPMTQLEQAEKSIERHRRRFAQHEALRWGIIVKGRTGSSAPVDIHGMPIIEMQP